MNFKETLVDKPWAIAEDKLNAIAELVALKSIDTAPMTPPIEARIDEQRESATRAGLGGGTIAVLPILGLLSHRYNWLSFLLGGSSMARLARQVRDLAADESVETIVLDIDSDGGMVEGTTELWQEIFLARSKKRIVAIANTTAASGAYWLATAASEIVATPSGYVGSVGVIHFHMEESKALEESGTTVTITRVPKYKGEGGNPFEPLSDEAKEHIKKRMDEAYAMFVKDVAKGRGISVSAVRKGFGEGRLVTAKEGLELGMVDKVATLDQTLDRFVGKKGKKSTVTLAVEQGRWLMIDDAGETLAAGPVGEASRPEFAGIEDVLFAGVIPKSPSNEWAPEDEAWEAPTLKDFTDKSWEELSAAEKRTIAGHFVWAPKMPPERFSDLKGPHHNPSNGKVNWRGLSNLAARFNQLDIPAEDKPKATAHLRGHYKDGDKDVPDVLKAEQSQEAKEENEAWTPSDDFRKRRARALALQEIS